MTNTTEIMTTDEIYFRVRTARALMREAADHLIRVSRAMGDERDFDLPADDAVSLLREAHDLAKAQGEQWVERVERYGVSKFWSFTD